MTPGPGSAATGGNGSSADLRFERVEHALASEWRRARGQRVVFTVTRLTIYS
jgi:hypothetical protein